MHCLGEFKKNKSDGKQDKARAMTSNMSQLKRAMNDHMRNSTVQKDLIGFMKVVARCANSEQVVTQAVDTYGQIVQNRQWQMVSSSSAEAAQSRFSDGGPNASSSDGGCSGDFVFLKEPDVEPVGPNSGEDPAIARRKNMAASDAAEFVRDALDYAAEVNKKNRNSFKKTADPEGMRKAMSYEDRVVVGKKESEVYTAGAKT